MAAALCSACGHISHHAQRGFRLVELECRSCGRGDLVAPVRLANRLGVSTWEIYQMSSAERAESWRLSEVAASPPPSVRRHGVSIGR